MTKITLTEIQEIAECAASGAEQIQKVLPAVKDKNDLKALKGIATNLLLIASNPEESADNLGDVIAKSLKAAYWMR